MGEKLQQTYTAYVEDNFLSMTKCLSNKVVLHVVQSRLFLFFALFNIMKPFALEPLLKHRKTREEQAMYVLAKAQDEEMRVQAQLNHETNVLESLLESLANEQVQGIEVGRQAWFEQRIELVSQQVQAWKLQLQKKQERVLQAREQLISRSQELKIMETLRDKQNQAWQQYLHHKETTNLDEIATIFHNRE